MDDHYIGKHCSDPTCRQKDYMPIECKFCKKTFCTEHYSIMSHNCSEMKKDKKQIYVCPFCNLAISVNQNLSLEQNLSIHEAMDCKFEYKQEKKAEVCGQGKCKTKISELNRFQCKICRRNLCLKHRMPEAHGCA